MWHTTVITIIMTSNVAYHCHHHHHDWQCGIPLSSPSLWLAMWRTTVITIIWCSFREWAAQRAKARTQEPEPAAAAVAALPWAPTEPAAWARRPSAQWAAPPRLLRLTWRSRTFSRSCLVSYETFRYTCRFEGLSKEDWGWERGSVCVVVEGGGQGGGGY